MIPSRRPHLLVAALTHPGMTGKDNEDRYSVSAYKASDENPIPSVFAIVADGIGGHRAGEIAAELAVETISNQISTSSIKDPIHTLEAAIVHASEAIYHKAEDNPGFRGMGSTCACAWVIGNKLYTASVGDTRIYLLRKDTIRQLTIDHTWVQEAIFQGAIRHEQARNHPNSHIIRRFLGSRIPVVPDLRMRIRPDEDDRQSEANQGHTLLPGDTILICSDGLTDLLLDEEILQVCRIYKGEKALQQLAGIANERGGHDNITLVSLSKPKAEPATVPINARKKHQRQKQDGISLFAWLLTGLTLLGIIGGVLWIYLEQSARTDNPGTTAAAPQVTLFPPRVSENPPEISLTAQRPGTTTTAGMTPVATSSSPGSLATFTPWPTNTPYP